MIFSCSVRRSSSACSALISLRLSARLRSRRLEVVFLLVQQVQLVFERVLPLAEALFRLPEFGALSVGLGLQRVPAPDEFLLRGQFPFLPDAVRFLLGVGDDFAGAIERPARPNPAEDEDCRCADDDAAQSRKDKTHMIIPQFTAHEPSIEIIPAFLVTSSNGQLSRVGTARGGKRNGAGTRPEECERRARNPRAYASGK